MSVMEQQRTFVEAEVQTDKRRITDKQRDALNRGRELYKERRDAYKKWEQERQKEPEPLPEPVPPPVVRQEYVRSIGFV